MRSVSGRGKYWNVGGDPGRFPASKKTLWYLWRLSNGKYKPDQNTNLSQEEAGSLIEQYKNNPNVYCTKNGHEETPIGENLFRKAFHDAINAANRAGNKWCNKYKTEGNVRFYIYDEETDEETPIYGKLGDCYLKKRGNTSFTDWLKKTHKELVQGNKIFIPHDYFDSYEFELKKVCELAALSVLNSYNINFDFVEDGSD